MSTREEVEAMVKEIKTDERLAAPPATVTVNAPLALIQLELQTKLRTLNWVLRLLEKNGDGQ